MQNVYLPLIERKTVKHTLLFLTLNTGGLMKNTERFWNKKI